MIILGIDPGYAILGYGIIDARGTSLSALEYGIIKTGDEYSFPERLEKLYSAVRELAKTYRIDHAAFEELFFCRNSATAIQVGAGRGVAILAIQQLGLPMYEYTPMQIKLAVTGNGHADKKQVQRMVKILLGLDCIPRPDDAADALGAALCHANTSGPCRNDFIIK
ncbi:MAG: Crossover junction endodeoxyribonuclease RuvC [Firmicutes bacterium ADurb.Bin182]|nr:MAG: Crossover junction endodeoxyribonuclease RuvC [Firmicutes bacterium ADurb.Bin182]